MKRITLNQLDKQMEDELGWFDYFVDEVYNGNLSHCKEVLNRLSRKETLQVLDARVIELKSAGDEYSDGGLKHRPSVERLYNYALTSLKERL